MGYNTMRMLEDNRMIITTPEGREIACDVLLTFKSEETGKNYIIYTNNVRDEDGNVLVSASAYDPEEKNSILADIETEEEWRVVSTIWREAEKRVGNVFYR